MPQSNLALITSTSASKCRKSLLIYKKRRTFDAFTSKQHSLLEAKAFHDLLGGEIQFSRDRAALEDLLWNAGCEVDVLRR